MAETRSPARAFAGIIDPASEDVSRHLHEWSDDGQAPSTFARVGCLGLGLHVSFVGWLDNRHELAEELAQHGHVIDSVADRNVAAHAYEQWGEAFVESLYGAFAVAVWDPREGQLILARDRAGTRSVYFSDSRSIFSFASELPRLCRPPDAPREVDPRAVDAYLTFQAVPAPLTIYRSVNKLPAAHVLQRVGGRTAVRRYWDIDFTDKSTRPLAEAAEELGNLLGRVTAATIRERTSALMLSGGLDSGLLLDALSRIEPRSTRTFTFAFPDKPEDAHASRIVAAHFGAEHRIFEVDPRVTDVLAEVFARYHQPYGNPSALTMRYTVPTLRDQADVVLTGEGADEVFGGRPRHRAGAIGAAVRRLPGAQKFADVSVRLPRNRITTAYQAMVLSPAVGHLQSVGVFSPEAKAELYSPELTGAVDKHYPRTLVEGLLTAGAHPVDQALEADFRLWVPEVLWVNFDAAQGAAGVELGAPYLDHRVVEFSARLPTCYRAAWNAGKVILRRLGHDRKVPLPRVARLGQSKMSLPEMLRGQLRPILEESVLAPRALARGYFRPAVLRALVDEHVERRSDNSRQLWALIMLEQWHRHWLDRHPTEP